LKKISHRSHALQFPLIILGSQAKDGLRQLYWLDISLIRYTLKEVENGFFHIIESSTALIHLTPLPEGHAHEWFEP